MKKETFEKVAALYDGNFKDTGLKSTSVGWPTPESHELRFDKLTSVINDSETYFSINDFGCGYGALLQYLINNRNFKVSEFNGYDISKEMLKGARRNLNSYNLQVNLYNDERIFTKADYTFVSGTYNVKCNESDESWKAYIHGSLENINAVSEKGFAFNLLSKYVDWEKDHLFYGDPLYWFDHCKKYYSKHVSLLHDYPLFEWTIIVKKKG